MILLHQCFWGYFLRSKHVAEVYQAIWHCNIVWSPPIRFCNQQQEARHQLAALNSYSKGWSTFYKPSVACSQRDKAHRSAWNSNECIGLPVPSALAPCFPSLSKLFTLKRQLRICAKSPSIQPRCSASWYPNHMPATILFPFLLWEDRISCLELI